MMVEFKIAIICLILSLASFAAFKGARDGSKLEETSAFITVICWGIATVSAVIGIWNV